MGEKATEDARPVCVTGTSVGSRTRLRRYSPSEQPAHDRGRQEARRLSTLFKWWLCLGIANSEQNISPFQLFSSFCFCSAFLSSLLLGLGHWLTLILVFLNHDSPACVPAQEWLHTCPRKISNFCLHWGFFPFFNFSKLKFWKVRQWKKEDLEKNIWTLYVPWQAYGGKVERRWWWG